MIACIPCIDRQIAACYQLNAAGAADAPASASGAGAAAVGGALAERGGISEAEDVSEAGLVAAVCDVRPEQLADVEAVAQGDPQAGMTQP